MNTNLNECDEILRVARLYTDGCAQGKSDIMKPAFHENATINGAPIRTLFEGVDQAGSADCSARIDILDVVNDIAVIRITLNNYFGADYIDFHTLKKDENGWRIVAKVYTDAPRPRTEQA